MKLILFANDLVGLNITKFLVVHYLRDLACVVTTEQNEIYELAQLNKIPVYIYTSTDQIVSELPLDADLGILAWWPKLIKKTLLGLPRYGFINTHPSLLPYNRGKHYNFWAIVEKAPFGVTLHKVDLGIDTGDVVVQKEIPYDWSDNGESLYKKAQHEICLLFEETYPHLRSDKINAIPQKNNTGSFHHSSEIHAASQIDLNKNYQARDLLNLLRARTFRGHPGCWFEDAGDFYEIEINIRKKIL